MKKADRKLLDASLDKALAAPKKDRRRLDSLLDDYDDSPRDVKTAPAPPTPRTPPTPPTSVSPQRDFTKVANSIVRELVSGGSFIGKSKQLYDYLYSRTRGAIVPKLTVAIPKPDLMKGAGIGSERTLLKNLKHLTEIGVVKITYTDGKHSGNSYTVLLPEETSTPPTPPTPPTPRHPRVELQSVPPSESGVGGVGAIPIESLTYKHSNTSFKTTTNTDDEAFAIFIDKFCKLSEEITGKLPSPVDRERWGELAETLINEFRQAATNTNTVSNIPAFLTAHLQRRFARVVKEKTVNAKKDLVGKGIPNPEPQVMTDNERDELRQMIIEMINGDDYTIEKAEAQFGAGLRPEDWQIIRLMNKKQEDEN